MLSRGGDVAVSKKAGSYKTEKTVRNAFRFHRFHVINVFMKCGFCGNCRKQGGVVVNIQKQLLRDIT